MLTRREVDERARSIRRHILNGMSQGDPYYQLQELRAARDELNILIRLQTPDQEERAAPGANRAPARGRTAP